MLQECRELLPDDEGKKSGGEEGELSEGLCCVLVGGHVNAFVCEHLSEWLGAV